MAVGKAPAATVATSRIGADHNLAGDNAFDMLLELEGVTADAAAVTCEMTSLGSSTHTAEVYLNGQLVSSSSGQKGAQVASVIAGGGNGVTNTGRPTGMSGSTTGTIRMSIGWQSPVQITLTGSEEPVMGDELHVIAEDPAIDVTSVHAMSITGANLDEIVVTDAVFDPVDPCPADTDGTGAVDVDDLIGVILSWGACEPPPETCDDDIDDSGAVDVDDLIAVILGWGTCP